MLPGFEWPWIRVFASPSFCPCNFVMSPALNGAPDLSQVPSPDGGCSLMGRVGAASQPYSHRLRGVINRVSYSSLDLFQVRWQGHPPSPKAPVIMFLRNSCLQGLCVPSTKQAQVPYLVWDLWNSTFTGKEAQKGIALSCGHRASRQHSQLRTWVCGSETVLRAGHRAVSPTWLLCRNEGMAGVTRLGGKLEQGGPRASRSCPFRLSRSLSVPRVSVFTSIKGDSDASSVRLTGSQRI